MQRTRLSLSVCYQCTEYSVINNTPYEYGNTGASTSAPLRAEPTPCLAAWAVASTRCPRPLAESLGGLPAAEFRRAWRPEAMAQVDRGGGEGNA